MVKPHNFNLNYLDNTAKEIQNEKEFKQKFIDFDKKQSKFNERFRKTVLKDYSRRNRNKEMITSEKPAYYDKNWRGISFLYEWEIWKIKIYLSVS